MQMQWSHESGPVEPLARGSDRGSPQGDPIHDYVAGRGQSHDGWGMNGRRLAQDLFCGDDRAARNDVGRGQMNVIHLWRVQRRRYPASAKRFVNGPRGKAYIVEKRTRVTEPVSIGGPQ